MIFKTFVEIVYTMFRLSVTERLSLHVYVNDNPVMFKFWSVNKSLTCFIVYRVLDTIPYYECIDYYV